MPSPPTDIPYRQAPNITVTHGFFGRVGGVSAGPYASLNCGFKVGDDVANAIANSGRVCQTLGTDPARRQGIVQTHSAICHVIDGTVIDPATEGDAMVTTTPGITLSVLTADCAPVLFAAPGIIAAAHAGWGGAFKGVLEATVDAMRRLGARDIAACIGPCIAQDSYEVSTGFDMPILAEDPAAAVFFRPGRTADKLHFDLPGYCAFRLRRAGLTDVAALNIDTLANPDSYFSHRRTTLAGETRRGLQMSAIAL